MKKIKIITILSLLFITGIGLAGNPIIKNIGMSDPHIRVFNDKIYLYCGHDDDPDDKTWVMKEWRVFSSTDLVNWTFEQSISPKDNYMDDNSTDCWASDAASRDDHYYFYFSDRKRGVGVMVSKNPTGPFKDALGEPLVSPMHDPTILIDDDVNKTPYIIYGDKEGSFHIARLENDMISLHENPKPITINGKEWENAPQWMDKNYIFKYNKKYYLSWGRDYAVSENIYGPYQCVGAVGNGHNLNEFAHGSFFWWNGQYYHIWCYYLRPGYKYRESIITYCHFTDEGKIVTDTDFLDKHFSDGVGQYRSSWSKIQAEWFYGKSTEIKKQECESGGFELANITDKSWIKFANVHIDNNVKKIRARVSGLPQNGKIEIRKNSLNGPLLGTMTISKIDETKDYAVLSSDIEKISGTIDLYFKFIGKYDTAVQFDWFSFD